MKGGIVREIERRILADFMDLLILSMMDNDDCAVGGYDVIKYLHKRFHFLPSPGSIYSHLYSLERKGLITATETGQKRVYSLTEKGREFIRKLNCHKEQIGKFLVNAIFKNGFKDSQ